MEPSTPGDANINYGRKDFPRILLNLAIILYIKQSSNTTYNIYLIKLIFRATSSVRCSLL